jgi:hypothetical protein
MARRTNLLATAYDVRTLDALREGISIKSGSDGSVDAFFAKQRRYYPCMRRSVSSTDLPLAEHGGYLEENTGFTLN